MFSIRVTSGGRKLNFRIGKTATVKELVEDILRRNKNDGNKSIADDESRWRNHLQPFFGHLRSVQVSSELIDHIKDRKSQVTRSEMAPKNATINREMSLLKAAFFYGTEQTPPKVRFVPHFNMLEENNVRRGFLQDAQYLRLSRECAVEGIWLVGLFETLTPTVGGRMNCLRCMSGNLI